MRLKQTSPSLHPTVVAAHESNVRQLEGWAAQMGLASTNDNKHRRMQKAVVVNGRYFPSASHAAAELGLHEQAIRMACNGHKDKRFKARFA
jgi:hypothetical protein